MDSSTKKFSIIGAAIGIIFLAVAFFLIQGDKLPKSSFQPEKKQAPIGIKSENLLPTVEGGTREIITKKIKTPEPDDKNVSKDIAVPISSISISGASGDASVREFEIKGENDKYSPGIIVVNNGDPVTVKFTAVDGDYIMFFPDFGVYIAAKKGETKKSQFQASPSGAYKFFCRDCGKPEMMGEFIVN